MFSTSTHSFSGEASATIRGRTGVPRSLFVAVGTWGTLVLSELRRELKGTYGSLENLPTLGWLSLGFAENLDPNWGQDERIALDFGLSSQPDWRHETVPESSEMGRAVFDSKLNGCAGMRARARLGFWNVWSQIESNLRANLGNVLLAQSGLQSAKHFGAVDDSLLNVYLIAHLGEATGGSAVFDLAYALRLRLLNGLNGPTQTSRILGVLGLPENAAPEQNRAIAYASLRELNHWNDSNTVWSSRGPAQARYTATKNEVPFDLTTLWTPQNAAGVALSKDDFSRAVTQWLSLDLHPNLASARSDDRTRMSELSKAVDEWNQPANYFAAGVASLEFPREAICQAVAARLARQTWETALAPQTLGNHLATAAREEAEKFARDFGCDARLLLEELNLEPEQGRALRIGDLTALHEAQWLGNISNLADADSNSAQALADGIYLQLAGLIAPRGETNQYSLSSPARFGSEGELATQVRVRFAGLEAKWRVAAKNFVESHVDEPRWCAEGTARIIEVLAQSLSDAKATLEAAHKELNDDIDQTWTQFEAIFGRFKAEELQSHGGFLGRNARRHQLSLSEQFTRTGAYLGSLIMKRIAVLSLKEAFSQAGELWQRPRADLKRFSDAVQENGRSIRQRGEAWENAPSVIGHLVLHPAKPATLREAATLYTRELSLKLEPARNLNDETLALPTLWRTVQQSAGNKIFVAIMTGQGTRLAEQLFEAALGWTRQFFQKSAALDLFKALYPDEHAAGNRVQELFRTADAFFPVALGTVVPGWNESQLRQLRRAGFHNADNELLRSEAEDHFFAVTKSLGFSNFNNSSNENLGLADTTRALFWSEIGGFALRCGGGYIRDLENAYNAIERGRMVPLHSRADVAFWLPIEAPAPYIQQIVWRDFLVSYATGAVDFTPNEGGRTGNFILRAGSQSLESQPLGQGAHFASANADSFIPWREVVFRCAEPEIQKALSAHIETLRLMSTQQLLEKIAAFLGGVSSAVLRHYLSEILSEWKQQFLEAQEKKLQEQLSKLKTILENPAQSRLHETARQKQDELQNELALLRGETAPANNELTAEQELERLLST